MAELASIFEIGEKGLAAVSLPEYELTNAYTPDSSLLREEAPMLPELSEVDLTRHYMALSRRAHGVDNGFYPLGSCTMKYNPKLNEAMAALPGFTQLHPLQDEDTVEGALELLFRMNKILCEISGMDETTLQPAAGAHGEWTGLQLIRAYHISRGEGHRTKLIVPDSSHGTNPASAAMLGYKVVSIPSTEEGMVDIEALRAAADENTAALMLTNPNTLGIFDSSIPVITDIVHSAGALLYYDGANMNAIMGVSRPGDMGFDVMHWNLHKTLSTPHGGGGPGSGPVGCKAKLAEFLPQPRITLGEDGKYRILGDNASSIGSVKAFYGNFLVIVKAFCYCLSLGGNGLTEASENAVLNANYMRAQLEEYSSYKYPFPCMHEFIMSFEELHKQYGISAMDVAKAMIDEGIHPPTMYFPLIVHEPLMFEPTETEARSTLDHAIEVVKSIIERGKASPDALHACPVTTPVGRLDEVAAARDPKLKYTK